MILFASDLHFGHKNIVDLCKRPFVDVDEMDAVLIERWNRKVKKNDIVYLTGDVVWDKKKVAYYMEQLSGKKILVAGNHDSTWIKREECQKYFEEIVPYLEVHLNGHPITMCHYPMLEWRSSREEPKRKLGYLIHGHIHNRIDIVDEEGYDGDRILSTRYLTNADLDKVLELKEKIKNRDRFMACENKELEFESIDDVEYAIDEAFEQVKVIKVEIPW